ncbi:MAG: RIP metalloprotease RseP [Alphaproteobacteria bacterium CG_4_9_14_3_um_filter_47_13]|nr:MAG: RIP metalloprotease RseP [Alphaproteobacteria bacterium CG_4_9_14_3_um_filter_47_13]
MSSSIFDWFQLMAANAWLYVGAFVLVLSILVFVHEWGHYIVARMCGVKIDTFSIGFGKELFGITDKNGTRWKFAAVPLGGYVKMFGDTDPASAGHVNGIQEGEEPPRPLTEDERKVAFYAKPVGQRSAIVLAGPAINFIFAIIILSGLYLFQGKPVTPPVASAIIGGSAAQEAGFLPHDEIIAIGNSKVDRFEDIRREVLVGLDIKRKFSVRREGEIIEIMAAPERLIEEDRFGFKHARGMLGLISPGNAIEVDHILAVDGKEYTTSEARHKAITERMDTSFIITLDRGEDVNDIMIHPLRAFNEDMFLAESESYGFLNISDRDDEVFVKYGIFGSVNEAVSETINITMSTLQALGQMVTGTRSATELGGIIRIGAIAGDMAQNGIIALITFTALLSINLGLINLFPIPMLDGGHLFFYIIEALKGSPLSEQIQEYAFRLGLALLVGIMLFANLNDIVQIIL